MQTETQTETITLGNFLRKPSYFDSQRQPFKPILDNFLYTTETMLFYGASGSAKSLFTLGLCCAYADDACSEFLGQEIGTGKVLYLDGEMHSNSIADRFDTFEATDLDNIDYLQMTEVVDTGRTVNLSKDSQRKAIVRLVAEKGYDLVVIDSVRTLFDLPDENASGSWNGVNDLAMQLRSKGASVIVIHHSNKSSYTDGEVIWSGSSNAVTVFDRTCGIQREADSVWSLVAGHKEGRSGHGFGDWVSEKSFTLEESESNFTLVDLFDERVSSLVDWCDGYNPDDYKLTRDRIQSLLKALSLPTTDRSIGFAWGCIESLADGEDLIPFNDKKEFTKFLKDGGSDNEF